MRSIRLAPRVRHSLAAALWLSVLASGAFAQDGRKTAVSHEALWLMKRVSSPSVSPDGKWVVLSVNEPAYDEKDRVSDLWVVRADGSEPARRLTATGGEEGGAAWSPDSHRIAFSARRDGDEVAQVYVIDVAGGEAQRVTGLSTGARLPRWRPDGKALLFTSTVYPGARDDDANRKAAADRKALRYRARVYDGFPIRYWDKWLDDMQTHVFVQELDAGAKARDLLAGTKLVAASGFSGRETNSGQDLDATWSPDGTSIVFAATTDRDTAAFATPSTHLWVVPAAGGEPRALTNGKGSYTDPTFAPDGKALFAAFTPQSGKVYNLPRLWRAGWPDMTTPSVVTAAFDRAVGNFAIAPDGGSVYFTAEDAGLERIHVVPSTGGAVTEALDTTDGVWGALSTPESGAGALFAIWESAVRPAEVFRVDLASKTRKALTNFTGEATAKLDWPPLRHFWSTSKQGKKIHNMLALPPAFDEAKKYPLLVLMHGGPASMWRDQITLRWNYHLLARPGYVVLLTNYTGSTGFGESFAQGIQGDPLRGPGNEINEAADDAIRRFPFVDGSRQAAAGASYGGHLANWMQATTTRYKCLISHAGLINLESQWGTSDTIYHREVGSGGPVWEQGKVWREQNPIRFAKNFKTPILVTVGENDFRVPMNQSIENWSVLQRLRIPSRLIVFPDANHWILKPEDSRFFYGEVHAWLKKYLGGD